MRVNEIVILPSVIGSGPVGQVNAILCLCFGPALLFSRDSRVLTLYPFYLIYFYLVREPDVRIRNMNFTSEAKSRPGLVLIKNLKLES